MAMKFLIIPCVMILFLSNYVNSSCFASLISFGDSLTDNGNKLIVYESLGLPPPHFGKPPYGISYFHKPTGRCSDGRLIIDFIAEYFGLPYVEPYFLSKDYSYGANFATGGATAQDTEFFLERGYNDIGARGSLDVQMHYCKEMLASLPPEAAHGLLRRSLIVMEIGGNDYNHFLLDGGSIDVVKTFTRPVIDKIGSAIVELIELGAVSFLVTGNLPMGCLTFFLQSFDSKSKKEDFDQKTGCINWLNDFGQQHNIMLREELDRIQLLYSHTTITYGDFYSAAMPIYQNPIKYGFVDTLVACCGGGGKYNYNDTSLCGDSTNSICDDPKTHANWDGYHLSEAANRIVTNNLFEGLKTLPQFQHCASKSSS